MILTLGGAGARQPERVPKPRRCCLCGRSKPKFTGVYIPAAGASANSTRPAGLIYGVCQACGSMEGAIGRIEETLAAALAACTA